MRRLTVPLALALAAVVLPTSVSAQAMPVCGDGAKDLSLKLARSTAAGKTTKVVIVSLDSVGSRAISLAGKEQAPTLHRLMRRGASTLNARTVRELTKTLPNHTTMVTGRRVDADHHGHGVWWNDERTDPATVQEAAGHGVSSVFGVAGSKDRETALFTAKKKLLIFERSWSNAIDRAVLDGNNRALARKARRDLVRNRRELTFLHLSYPDVVGHQKGFLTAAHLAAVEEADRLLGTLVSAIEARPRLRRHVTVIVTADHGGGPDGHGDAEDPVNYRIPFIVWGAGVAKGADLYKLNSGDYRNPGKARTQYRIKRPPVRNGDAANLATDLLGLRAVKGSQFNRDQSLDVR
jgi:predicted AlkP superfamily pyrophosphatase or phosphodiesterase